MPSRSATLLGLVLTLGLAAPTVASACRVNQPPEARIAGAFDAVVVARVTRAGYTAAAQRDWHPWQGEASVARVVKGAVGAPAYSFGRTGSTAACDDGQPPPAVGETWVLYLRKTPDGAGLQVKESYPLAIVRDLDPRLAGDR